VLSAAFNNISGILWRSGLLVEEIKSKVQIKTLQGLMTLFIIMYFYIFISSAALKFGGGNRSIMRKPVTSH